MVTRSCLVPTTDSTSWKASLCGKYHHQQQFHPTKPAATPFGPQNPVRSISKRTVGGHCSQNKPARSARRFPGLSRADGAQEKQKVNRPTARPRSLFGVCDSPCRVLLLRLLVAFLKHPFCVRQIQRCLFDTHRHPSYHPVQCKKKTSRVSKADREVTSP